MAVHTSTHQKALAVNLEPSIYGTVAEIGAGQEVARWLFRVGGAAGTIAKTVSAYDTTVSDELYGKAPRYVSRERLEAMLGREWRHLMDELGPARGERTRFFVFADTVSARNYQGTNECHGWVGLRFQTEPGGPPSDVLLHVHLLDSTNLHQQEAVGVLGINLIHAAFFEREPPRMVLERLLDGLSLARVEVDCAHVSGPAWRDTSPLDVGATLVGRALTTAVLFERGGRLVPPTEALHKRPVVVLRGRLTRADEHYTRLLRLGGAALAGEGGGAGEEPLALLETGLQPIGDMAPLGPEDVADGVRAALHLAPYLLVTRFAEHFELTHYLRRYTHAPIRFVVGARSLIELLEARHYGRLAGGLVEGLGRVFADNVRLYVCPMQGPDGRHLAADHLPLDGPIRHLHRFLLEMGWLVPLDESV